MLHLLIEVLTVTCMAEKFVFEFYNRKMLAVAFLLFNRRKHTYFYKYVCLRLLNNKNMDLDK